MRRATSECGSGRRKMWLLPSRAVDCNRASLAAGLVDAEEGQHKHQPTLTPGV